MLIFILLSNLLDFYSDNKASKFISNYTQMLMVLGASKNQKIKKISTKK